MAFQSDITKQGSRPVEQYSRRGVVHGDTISARVLHSPDFTRWTADFYNVSAMCGTKGVYASEAEAIAAVDAVFGGRA